MFVSLVPLFLEVSLRTRTYMSSYICLTSASVFGRIFLRTRTLANGKGTGIAGPPTVRSLLSSRFRRDQRRVSRVVIQKH